MKSQICAVALICLLVACTPKKTIPAATEISGLPTSAGNHLYQALSLMPENANYVEFTDWGPIKKNEGFEGLSSADEIDKRLDFYTAILDMNFATCP